MASGSWTHEIESAVEASRLFKAAVLDWHALGPKILPEVIVSGCVIEGDGVGAVRQINFSPVVPYGYVKERLDLLDMEKLESKQTLVEGGAIGSKLETATMHFKFVPKSSGGGCVCKAESHYKLLPGVEDDPAVTAKSKEDLEKIIRAAEAYLLANPDAYLQ